MKAKKNRKQLDDIKLLVDSFYVKVGEDNLPVPIFNQRVSTFGRPKYHLHTILFQYIVCVKILLFKFENRKHSIIQLSITTQWP